MEYEAGLDTTLIDMEMRAAFCSSGSADFSRLTPTGACISRVQHNTFLKVDEEST